MNKFVLQIILKINNVLDIKIIHWDKEYLDDNNVKRIHYHIKDNFIIYILDDGKISNNVFVLPFLKNLKPNHIISYKFKSDVERHSYLKKLYYCLEDWGINENKIIYNRNIKNNNKIIVNGEFWVM
ncbi:MAG: hypothetical protein WDA02_03590 [Saccharofermentanales bacterium]